MLQGIIPVVSDDALRRIESAALRLLDRVGMRVPSETLLTALEAYGAKVDRAGQVARFPESVVGKTIALLDRGTKATDPLIARKMDNLAFDWGYEAFFLYDWKANARRTIGTAEAIELIKAGHAMPEIATVGMPVLVTHTDQAVEAIEACEILYNTTSKHRGAGIRRPEQVKYLIEIDRILGYGPSNMHFVQAGRCMISPMGFGKDAARVYEELIRHGYTEQFWVATMPIAGASAPVTPAAVAAQATAEILAGWCIGKAVNPKAAVFATVITGNMDLRTGKLTCSTPEAVLQDAAVWQLFKRLCGVEIGYDPGGYTDAKVPGLQAAFEKTFRQMAFGCVAGPGPTLGSLDNGRTFSPTQAVIDMDMSECMWRFFGGMEVSDETLAVDEMLDVGLGEGRDHLATDHTLRHCRGALWHPRLFDRTPWQDVVAEVGKEQEILARADQFWRDALARYQPPPVDKDKARAIHEVVERARRQLA